MALDPLTEATLARLPVFPLPGTVLFPGTAVPLHIFEPRHAAMVEACMADAGAIAVTLLKEDADPMALRAEIHPVACAGRIVHCESLPEGRFNVLVHGLDRVRLIDELPLENGFRRFRAERVLTSDSSVAGTELGRLHSCVLSLNSSVERTDQQLVEVLHTTSDPVELTDILSAVLVADPAERQVLLETESLRRRIRMLIDSVAEVMVRVGEPITAKLN